MDSICESLSGKHAMSVKDSSLWIGAALEHSFPVVLVSEGLEFCPIISVRLSRVRLGSGLWTCRLGKEEVLLNEEYMWLLRRSFSPFLSFLLMKTKAQPKTVAITPIHISRGPTTGVLSDL